MSGAFLLDCQVVRKSGAGLEPTRLLAPSDEAYLMLRLGPVPDSLRQSLLWVALARGDALRDVTREPLADLPRSGTERAYRLCWSQDPARSWRLSVRVLLDEQPLQQIDLLLARPEIDGQGRIRNPGGREPSSATLRAFVNHLVDSGNAGVELPP